MRVVTETLVSVCETALEPSENPYGSEVVRLLKVAVPGGGLNSR